MQRKPSKDSVVLIDSDMQRYTIGGVEMPHPFLPGEFIPASVGRIHELVDASIQASLESTGASTFECVLSGTGNFRYDVAKQQPYKGTRDPNNTRPYHYDTIGNYLVERYGATVVNGIEADDYIGMKVRANPEKYIASSRDKDFKTFHGWHHRPACGKNQVEVPLHWVSEFEASHFFFYQMLIGDNTDNIGGCGVREWRPWGIAHVVEYCNGAKIKIPAMRMRRKGVGKKTAIALLKDAETVQQLYDIVQKEYEKIFPDKWEEVMLENARLLFIGQTPEDLFNWSWINYEIKKEEITND